MGRGKAAARFTASTVTTGRAKPSDGLARAANKRVVESDDEIVERIAEQIDERHSDEESADAYDRWRNQLPSYEVTMRRPAPRRARGAVR